MSFEAAARRQNEADAAAGVDVEAAAQGAGKGDLALGSDGGFDGGTRERFCGACGYLALHFIPFCLTETVLGRKRQCRGSRELTVQPGLLPMSICVLHNVGLKFF